jgi:hypothetical protein
MIANMTGGKEYADNAAALEDVARSTDLFRPVPESFSNLQALWPWMVFLTALCLLLDVGVRRIAIDPEVVWTKATALWLRLRGRAPAPTKMAEYIERLKSRKAQVSESMDKQKATTKFEPTAGAPTKPIDAPTVVGPALPEKPKPAAAPKKDEPKEDFASRLMKAKKKAMEERDKDKPK